MRLLSRPKTENDLQERKASCYIGPRWDNCASLLQHSLGWSISGLSFRSSQVGLLRYCLKFGSAEKCSADLYVLPVYNVPRYPSSPVNHQSYHPSQSNTTPFLSVPIPSITTSICAPGTRYLGGERPAPTPKNPSQLNQFHPQSNKTKTDKTHHQASPS